MTVQEHECDFIIRCYSQKPKGTPIHKRSIQYHPSLMLNLRMVLIAYEMVPGQVQSASKGTHCEGLSTC